MNNPPLWRIGERPSLSLRPFPKPEDEFKKLFHLMNGLMKTLPPLPVGAMERVAFNTSLPSMIRSGNWA